MSAAWKDPDFQGGAFKKLIVLGIGDNPTNTRLFEDEFVMNIMDSGSSAMASYRVMPNIDKMSEEEIKAAVREGQYDGVLVTRLLGVDKDTEYIPPSSYVTSAPYMYGGYYGYYHSSYAVVHEPGYTQTYTTVRLETNLYDSATEKLVWSGHSSTFDPRSTKDGIVSVTPIITSGLVQAGLIGK
jgi:hypothetical protein